MHRIFNVKVMTKENKRLTLGKRLIQNLLVDRCLHLQLWHRYNSLSANSSSLVKLLRQSKKKSEWET